MDGWTIAETEMEGVAGQIATAETDLQTGRCLLVNVVGGVDVGRRWDGDDVWGEGNLRMLLG